MSSADKEATDSGNEPEGIKLPLGLKLDLEYVKSAQGIIKAIVTVVSVIAAICVGSEKSKTRTKGCNWEYGDTYDFFMFVSLSAFICGLVIYFVSILALHKKLPAIIPWLFVDMGWTGLYVIFYFSGSAALAAATRICKFGAFQAATVFGFVCFALLGISLLVLFLEFRRGRTSAAATTTKTTTTTSTEEPPFEQY